MIGEIRDFEKPVIKWAGYLFILAVLFTLLMLMAYPDFILGDNSHWSRHIHQSYPGHSTLETIIGIVSILLGFSIWSRKKKQGESFLNLLPLGLWPMGMLALAHSFISTPNEFIFLYSASLLAGALGFSLCWLNIDIRRESTQVRTPWIVLLTSLAFAALVWGTSSFGISMSESGSFTRSASAMNLVAGLLFAFAALKLFSEALKSKNNLLLYMVATIALTGSLAGLTFPFSQAWSHGWWAHHLLRLAAFVATLAVLQKMNNRAEIEKEHALSERTKMAAELKIKQERLSLALKAARDGIWDWDLEKNELYYSPAWSGMLGYEENELLGSLEIWESLVHPEDIDGAKQSIEAYMTGKVPSYSIEFRMKHKQGHYLNILARGEIIKNESDQKPIRFIGTHSDLTEIRRTEKELLLFKKLVEKSSHGCGLGTLDGKVTYMNPSLMLMLGIDDLEDVIGTDLASFYPDDLREKIYGEILPEIMEKGSWEGESRLKGANGSLVPVLENFFLIRDSKNQPLCLAVVIVDISPIKQALATLEESESRLMEFFNMTDNLVTQVDGNGRFLFINQQASRIYGFSPEECLGRAAFDFIHPDDRATTQQSFQKWIADRAENVSFENRQVSKDGNIIDMLWSINPKYDADGNVIHIWSIARDISEIKAYENKLRAANLLIDKEKEFSKTVINSLPGVFYLFDEKLKFQLWNKNFENVTGYTAQELASLSPLELFDRNEASLVAERIGETFTSGTSSVEADFVSKDGTRKPFYLTGLHIEIEGKNYLLGVGVDISMRKKAEQEKELALATLQERMKEQRCLFSISEAVKSSESLDVLFLSIINSIQEGWQYPEITRCRIIFDDKIFSNDAFEPTEFKLISNIVSRNENRGVVEVYYLEKRPEIDEGPFLNEERIMLDQIALRIGEAASLYQSTRDRKARLGIGEGFLEIDEKKAYKAALDKILETMDSQYGMLGYIDEKGAMVYPSITNDKGVEHSVAYSKCRFPSNSWSGLLKRSLAEKITLFSNKELPVPEGHLPIKNSATAPILLRDQLVGHINVANKKSGYTINDIRLLETLAEYMAPIIEARRQQKFADIALQNERYQLKTLFNSTSDIIYVADPEEYRLLYVNGAFRDVWGKDVIGRKCHKVLQNRDDPCPFCTNDKIFGENLGKAYIWEFQNEKTQKWFRCADKAITWSDGRLVRFEMATDITESKIFAQGQIRTEKLSALGLVAAGVAHELNNPLMGVLNYTQYCLHKTEKEDKRYSVLMDIEQETRRCTGIVENLLSASRMDNLTAGTVMEFNPEKVIDAVVRLLEYRTSKEKISVSKKTEGEISGIKMSRDAFQQLFMNLYTNAIDSLENSEEKDISIKISEKSNQLILEITDTGSGISHEIREKIFDPFYTTKAPGKGTGLGLATCWKIVHAQGGYIDFRSRPNFGTTMTVFLPKQVADVEYQM